MKRMRGAALLMLMLVAVTSVRAEDVKSLAQGNNAFAWDMYDKLKGEEGNIFFSPFSLRTALAMTYAGAGGETAREREKALRFAPEDATLHASLAETIQGLEPKEKKGYQLSVANSLWGQKGFEFLKPFLEVCKRHYGGGLTDVDFARDAEKARVVINQWVEEKTQKKIQNLIPKGALSAVTRLVLVNAVWFKGDWLNRFSESETREEAFYKGGGTTVRAPLMHRLGSGYRYAEADGVQILEMPYRGDRLSMVVLLPKEREGLSRLEGMLNSKKVDEWMGRLVTP